MYPFMACMRDIRKRSDRTEACFGPINAAVALLSKHGLAVSPAVLKQLEEAPLAWKSLKKKMFHRCVSHIPVKGKRLRTGVRDEE